MSSAAQAVPLSQHSTQLLEGCSEPGTATVPSWRDALPMAACVGEAQTPQQGTNPGLGMSCSHLSFPRAGVPCPRVRAVPGAAFADLVLDSWELHCERNGREHRTADMGCKQLVVRRGQPFSITLRFSGRAYDEAVDKLSFNVETGECRHFCVARKGCVGVTMLWPCPGAHLCSQGTCPMSHSPCSAPGTGWCCAQLLCHKNKR